MKNKGFTLVEILAILAVLGVIVMIVLPNIGGSTEEKKEKELQKKINMIENSAKVYHSFNSDEYKIRLNTLVDEKYLVSDMTNPKTGELLDGCVNVTLDEEDIFKYTYGSCESIEVPLIVELNGGIPSQDFATTYLDSTKIELIDPTSDTGEFNSWKLVKGNSILKGSTLIIGTEETILHALWTAFPSLEVDFNGGSGTDKSGMYKSGTNIILEVPTKLNYKFIGWKVVSGNSMVSGNRFTMGTTDTKIKAEWIKNPYLEIDLNGGGIENNVSSYYETGTIVNLGIPIREGYTFTGWKRETGDSGISGNTLTMGNNDTKIKATWAPIIYTITLNLNGGSGVENSTYTIETDTFTLGIPSRSGYKFIGWTEDNESEPNINVNIEKGSTGNREYTANWEALNPVYAYSCKNGNAGNDYVFTYTGDCEVIDDGTENWRVKFLSDGVLNSSATIQIDAFLVGGGGGGGKGTNVYGGGGGGGYTTTAKSIFIKPNINYTIDIGDGGSLDEDGKTTSAFNVIVSGGKAGKGQTSSTIPMEVNAQGAGGDGGSGGGCYASKGPNAGGNDGGNGYCSAIGSDAVAGKGQGTTTREFGETTGTLYSGGGGGGTQNAYTPGSGGEGGGGSGGNDGIANTGGGGGGYIHTGGPGGKGGSGIVVIRNTRTPVKEEENQVPIFTYSGTYEILNDNNELIGSSTGNWKIRFLTSGTLKLTELRGSKNGIDVFLVGGGGGGGKGTNVYGGGGGGGYTTTVRGVVINTEDTYTITVGAGGAIENAGYPTTAFNATANGGKPGKGQGANVEGAGGDGGSGGGCYASKGGNAGGNDGGNGYCSAIGSSGTAGTGQGTTTREFGETTGRLYAGGGGGGTQTGYVAGLGGEGGGGAGGLSGTANTGGGGGGWLHTQGPGGSGGSGIVVIRNKR